MIASSPLPFQDGGDLLYSKEYNTPSWEDETLTVTRREERPGKRTCTIPAFWREAPLGSSDAQEESPPRQLLHNEPEPTESGYDEATPPDPLASPEILLLCAEENNLVVVSRNRLKPTESFLQTQKQ